MTRGNQRELARAKNQKKLQQQGKKHEDGLNLTERKERDAQKMRDKQKKAVDKKEDTSAQGATGGK